MEKSFNSYIEFFNDLKGQNLTTLPALLFFFNAAGNSLGCNCQSSAGQAIKRYKSLMTSLNDTEKIWLKQRYNVDTLKLRQGNESYIINL